jgi:hypothetical protein
LLTGGIVFVVQGAARLTYGALIGDAGTITAIRKRLFDAESAKMAENDGKSHSLTERSEHNGTDCRVRDCQSVV